MSLGMGINASIWGTSHGFGGFTLQKSGFQEISCKRDAFSDKSLFASQRRIGINAGGASRWDIASDQSDTS